MRLFPRHSGRRGSAVGAAALIATTVACPLQAQNPGPSEIEKATRAADAYVSCANRAFENSTTRNGLVVTSFLPGLPATVDFRPGAARTLKPGPLQTPQDHAYAARLVWCLVFSGTPPLPNE
jgi:hypothetical protein